MIYNSAKIKKLLNSIEDNLTEEQQSIVKEIVFNYNKLNTISLIKWKKETLFKRKWRKRKIKRKKYRIETT